MLKEIYTLGYGNCSSTDLLLTKLEKYKINLIIDVRLKPRAWTFKWSAPYLQKILGEKYISVPELGNTTGKSNWIPPDWEKAEEKLKEVMGVSQSAQHVRLTNWLGWLRVFWH